MVIGSQFHLASGWSTKESSIVSVVVEGFVAGSCACAMKLASPNPCLTISTGSETFHSMGVSFGRKQFEPRNGLSATPDR